MKGELERKSKYSTKMSEENSKSKSMIKSITKDSAFQTRATEEPLKTKTNEFLNLSQDCKLLQKQRMRSTSVEGSNQTQTQKYHIPRPPINGQNLHQTQEKKVPVPK